MSDTKENLSNLLEKLQKELKFDPSKFDGNVWVGNEALGANDKKWLINHIFKAYMNGFLNAEKRGSTLYFWWISLYINKQTISLRYLIEEIKYALERLYDLVKLDCSVFAIYQDQDGRLGIYAGMPGSDPLPEKISKDIHQKLVSFWCFDKNEWYEPKVQTFPLSRIETSKPQKKLSSDAFSDASSDASSKVSSKVSSDASIDPWKKSEVVSDNMSDTTQTTQPLPNMALKSGSSDSEFERVLNSLKKSDFKEDDYKRLQKVVAFKMDAKMALEKL